MRSVSLPATLMLCLGALSAQTPPAAPGNPAPGVAGAPANTGPLVLDLAGALERARNYSQQLFAAGVASSLAHEDRVQAKAAFFPTVNQFNQYIYTQGNGTSSGVFVANDGVHIYSNQAVVHEDLFSVTRQAEYRRAQAAEAAARARRDIAARGLVATVVQNYYALAIAQRRAVNAQRSVEEARRFLDISQKQESGGEVAHADVIKAQLQLQQRQRELMDAETNTEKAKIALAVLLFPDISQPFDIVDDLRPDAPLTPMEEVRTLAFTANPEIRAAEAGVQQASFGVKAAQGAYFPSLAVDYFFGINANVFGLYGPDDRKNIGSVVQGTVNIPVWNWGATRSKVRQAEWQKRQAEFDLAFSKKQVQADVRGLYLEAETARAQLASLHDSSELSAESLRLTILRYQSGEATALEVVDAQSTLAQARNAYDDGLARYRVALANLQTLTGRF